MATVKEGAATPRRVLDLTLRGVHHICINSVPGDDPALQLQIENVETGDKFGRTVAPRELPSLVPEKLRADAESLDDLEFLLVEGLTAEQAAGDGVAVEEPPAILSASKESAPAADGQLAQRFTIHVRVLKGLPGRQKVHTLELVAPVTAVATKDDAVSIPPHLTTHLRLDSPLQQFSTAISMAALTRVHAAQIRIMFRKVKENFERTNADLRAELDLLRLQSNNRVFFGVAHSVSRFATALKTCTVAAVEDGMFKPVPKTEVGTFRPEARAKSALTVVPSIDARKNENWVRGHVDWTPEVKLTGGCFEADADGGLVVKRVR